MRLYKKGHRLKVIRLPKDDKQLIARAIEHDRAAQRELFERFAPKMLGVCRRYISDLHHAEDVMLTGFFRVFHHLEQFRGDGSFEGWIRRIMVRESISFLRKNKDRDSEYDEAALKNISGENNAAVADLEAEHLQELIDGLPRGYRMVFVLSAIEGYTHSEIADLLQISEGTSKSQLYKARKMLQDRLELQRKRYYGTEEY